MLTGRVDELAGCSEALVRLITAWQCLEEAGADLSVVRKGVGRDALWEYSSRTGLSLPHDLSLLYGVLGGFVAVEEAWIELYGWPPVTMAEIGVNLDGAVEPASLRWFGGNAGSELFGVWLPGTGDNGSWAPAVVTLDMTPDGCVVAAGGVVELLTELTIVGLQVNRPPGTDDALDAIQVPAGLRVGDPEEKAFVDAVAAWADPTLGHRGYYAMQTGRDLAHVGRVVKSLAPE